MAKPSARTIARSRLTRARNESFCHMSFVQERNLVGLGAKSSSVLIGRPLTDKNGDCLIEAYSNLARVARLSTATAATRCRQLTRRGATIGSRDQCQCVS